MAFHIKNFKFCIEIIIYTILLENLVIAAVKEIINKELLHKERYFEKWRLFITHSLKVFNYTPTKIT